MFEYQLDLAQHSSFIITMSFGLVGMAFLIGFTVKKLLQFMKSF